MIDIFDKKIAAVPIDARGIEKETKRLEKTLREVRAEISKKTKETFREIRLL